MLVIAINLALYNKSKSMFSLSLTLCSDGVGRSGTFCAIYSILERVKLEQVVDVFQAIKVIRVRRPLAVETLVGF